LASSIFLISFACIALAYAGYQLFGPGRYTPWERFLYAPVYALARVLWRVEIEWRDGVGGRDSRPASAKFSQLLAERVPSGALLIANHRCSLDPFFVQLVSGKRVHWMVAGEYFKHFLFGPILKSYQAIPTNRGGVDTASTKRAIALAKSGSFVGMFPEGRINRSKMPLLSIRPGAAIVAIRAGVPLVPIWIEGAPRGWEVYSALFMPAKVKILVGPPNRFDDSATDNKTSSNSIDEPVEDLRSERVQARDEAVAWITRVMQESLSMGGQCTDDISMASANNWVDS
jgi:1-acyl-sn-glycerol-3-phosphate acyltransferase